MSYHAIKFKKQLKEILGADWLRFYWSSGKTHLCLKKWDIGEKNIPIAISILQENGIDFVLQKWGVPFDSGDIHSINIPIDQEAFPQPKRNKNEAVKYI